MVFQCINIRQVPWEVLKTAAFGLSFQHLPQDLANVNAWKAMFDPCIIISDYKVTQLLSQPVLIIQFFYICTCPKKKKNSF